MTTKKLLLNLIILWFFLQNIFAANIPAGNVFGKWTQANSPYLVFGNITVPQDSLLQIDPGVVVQFQGHYQLRVLGRILALGSASDTITFTAVDDWWGIRFDGIQATQDSSLFISCKIERGSAKGTGNYAYGGGFFISSFSKIRIENAEIINNKAKIDGGGVYCINSSPIIVRNKISGNDAGSYYGGGIYCNNSSPVIRENIISNNVGNICCRSNSSPLIYGNTITNSILNVAIFCEYSSPEILNNIISYNPMGIYMANSSPNVKGNVITFNRADYGAGIRCRFNSNPQIINNTIANNTANIYGGGLYTDYSSSPVVKNTILWGNYAPNLQGRQLALDQSSSPAFSNCDIQGGSAEFYYYDAPNTFTGTYINNIDLDPLFNDESGNIFSLQGASPCINAGVVTEVSLPSTDLAGNPRLCNNAIDIGAYEICTTGLVNFVSNNIKLVLYPNPSSDFSTLEILEMSSGNNFILEIINEIGILTKQILITDSKTVISTHELASGIYFYQLRNNNELISSGKIIVR
jgi:parallel beta-helix repeat protein